MNIVLNNKDLLNKIKKYIYYTDEQLMNFKSQHYFFNQYLVNKEIKWIGFILNDDINFEWMEEDADRIIYTNLFLKLPKSSYILT